MIEVPLEGEDIISGDEVGGVEEHSRGRQEAEALLEGVRGKGGVRKEQQSVGLRCDGLGLLLLAQATEEVGSAGGRARSLRVRESRSLRV